MIDKLKNSQHKGLRGAMVKAVLNYYEKRQRFPLPARITTVDRETVLAENKDLLAFNHNIKSQRATFSWVVSSLGKKKEKPKTQYLI